MTGWLVPTAVAALLTGAYLAAWRARPTTLPPWSPWRTAAWVAGVALVAVALAPPLLGAAQGDDRAHMVQHLLLGMYAPLGLVVAAPFTLALGSLPQRSARALTRVLRSGPVHVLAHPVTAAVLNVGGMFVLYLTPLHAAAAEAPALNALVLTHFLLAGWLYTWAVAGPDPAPRRPSVGVRVAVLVLSAGAHAFLAKLLYARAATGHSHHGTAHAEAAAQLMYYGGDGAEVLLAVLLFAGWYRRRR